MRQRVAVPRLWLRNVWRALFWATTTAALSSGCGSDESGSVPTSDSGGAPPSDAASGEAGLSAGATTVDAGGDAGFRAGTSSDSMDAGFGGDPTGAGAPTDAMAGEAGAPPDPGHDTCAFPRAAQLQYAVLEPGFCAWGWATGIAQARGIASDGKGNVLVVESGTGNLLALWDADGDGVSGPTERAILSSGLGLGHGLNIGAGYLYATTDTTVYRWKYAGERRLLSAPSVVITHMPAGGHHTRTVVSDARYLYVSVGSAANYDADSSRARVLRFPLSALGAAPLEFVSGDVFADGLRNSVGLGFDTRGQLWSLDNGQDELSRTELGGDIHEDNPADELNRLTQPGAFYGFPYCWSEYSLPSGVSAGRGSQWGNPYFLSDGVHTDSWCHSVPVRPVLALQAHSAPLDILFYAGTSLPSAYRGGAFLTYHGSWNRTEPTGYRLMYVAMSGEGLPMAEPRPILSSVGSPSYWKNRPVGLTTLPNGVILMTNDAGDPGVVAIGYKPQR